MRKVSALLSLLFFFTFSAIAQKLTGVVKDNFGYPLAYASVFIKGSSTGTTANNKGEYSLTLSVGTHTVICQYVGYDRAEKTVEIKSGDVKLDFVLMLQPFFLQEVIVRPGGEDPAYEIIRNAIRKRKEYVHPLDSFTCEAYIKTLIKTRRIPKRILGQKIDPKDMQEMGVDSSGKGIIHLSESLTKIAYKKPDQYKLEVLSGRESGSGGYGFNFPTFINFYENSVNILTAQLNPRGYVSPVAEGAMNYYKYQYLGSFIEEGKEVNKIRVIPRRKFEPLFAGFINITDGDWRIHSLDLLLTKESQLEILDTVRITQIHLPVSPNVWQTKDQVVHFTFKQFGIDAVGSFLNVYNKFDLDPSFSKKYFNNIVVKYDTAINKRTKQYWDSIRPVQLEPEELRDYVIKDSAYKVKIDSSYSRNHIDSLRKRQGKVKLMQVLWEGFARSNFRGSDPFRYSMKPLIRGLQYNTVEGLVVKLEGSLEFPVMQRKYKMQVLPYFRYGFSNGHFNTFAKFNIWRQDPSESWGGNQSRMLQVSGGKKVSQFNNENPIFPFQNTFHTLFYERNYMKIYENYFVNAQYSAAFGNGFRGRIRLGFEDRLPLDNTTDFKIIDRDNKEFTPNYPYEKISEQFERHQAFLAGFQLDWQPGQQFIQYPRGKIPLGSKYPTFSLRYEKGIPGLVGSDVDFDKWSLSVWDDMNFKLRGRFSYRLMAGGFLNDDKVAIQDYQHFNGNQVLLASDYLNSFQLAPYYSNSTTASLYGVAHIEHHFNGMITNKIPLFRRLNWHLVGGANAFYVNGDNNYVEIFGGLENILKIMRVDIIGSYLNGSKGTVGIRIGFGGLIGSAFRPDRTEL